MRELKNKRIVVTGLTGFLGGHVKTVLESRNAEVINWAHNACDLRDVNKSANYLKAFHANYVLHLAGYNGGIRFNKEHPAKIFTDNSLMALSINHACARAEVDKLVSIISSCAYPSKGWNFLPEESFWEGLSDHTVFCHGMAKRTLQAAAIVYKQEFDLDSVCAVLTHFIGPGDSFGERTKVVGALIRRFVEAYQSGAPSVEVWGTGAARREFIWVGDAAEGVVQTLEKYEDSNSPLNIGSSTDMSIKELVDNIVYYTGYTGEVKWLTDKPDGQIKKVLQTDKMREILDLNMMPVQEALRRTIEWYIENKEEADKRW